MNIGSTMAMNARRHPDKEAIIYGDKRYTYQEFNERVNQLANGLLSLNVQKGDKVALMMKNSDQYAICFYAAAKIGAVLVPINFRLVSREVRYILEQSDATFVFCDDEFAENIEESRSAVIQHVICTSNSPFPDHYTINEILSEDRGEPQVTVEEHDDVEILYTSGTTGRPKGVLLDHKRVMNVGIIMLAGLGLNPKDRFLHIAPLFHSAQLNLFMVTGFFLGATHVIHRDFHPVSTLETIGKEQITFFFGVPAMYTHLLQVPNKENYDLSSITRCAYGAAPMAPEIVKQSIELFKMDQFYNLCGLTEGGPGGIILMPEDHATKLGSGGKAFFFTEARVVDESMQDVQVGRVGELVLRGETIMKEYYKKPEETKKAFEGGWLHTGDLAQIDEEGFITIVDRKKDMMISGGENVYSIEVEEVMYEHPQVLEAATIGIPDKVWGEMVAAVIVPKPGEAIDEDEFQKFCRQSLAGYKVPRKLFIVEQLPRNASGKILKFQLRETFKEQTQK
ncbi:class I adenylate-forming enzyme family protein [Guptibacillus hwajinpoensis]|uniref:Feruloyl-CoA synthase n=1 Tax=Guptibacillus hwajinpoensis TaxID=208199 RepID=A0ABU0K322_9BACL|nr:long-chain fatty acid--CoA ligase [Alkalihalobacillus hemicentroti]MDQ0483752.1 feruloyl-CoA synthase [Alkalihalobacillus hemicentroti]